MMKSLVAGCMSTLSSVRSRVARVVRRADVTNRAAPIVPNTKQTDQHYEALQRQIDELREEIEELRRMSTHLAHYK